MPELWEAMEICFIFRWARRRGTVSRYTGMRWETGTRVEPPKPGLEGLLDSVRCCGHFDVDVLCRTRFRDCGLTQNFRIEPSFWAQRIYLQQFGCLGGTHLSMNKILTFSFSANQSAPIPCNLVPNIPVTNNTVGTSPSTGPVIEYVTFNRLCLSVAGKVKIWWNFRGATSSMAYSWKDCDISNIAAMRQDYNGPSSNLK